MFKVDRIFILFGVVAMLIGIFLGERMGATGDQTQRVTHVHAMALGWIGAFLFGLCYRAWPMLAGKLAWAHVTLHVIGVSVMLVMLYLMFGGGLSPAVAGPVLGVSGLAVGLGVILFAINFLMRAGAGAPVAAE